MKHTVFTIIGLLLAMVCHAAPVVEQANQAYDRELYKKALELYTSQEKTGEVSSDLYYNIGNTYYRLNDAAHAILYYERALLLDPGNFEARSNLQFVRERTGINHQDGANIIQVAINTVVARFSSNTWAVLALVAFLLMLAGVAAYLWLDSVGWRKTGFFSAMVMLVVVVASVTCAVHNRNVAVDRNAAIVVADNVALSHAPRPAKDKSEVAFELVKGVKVTITDRVGKDNNRWLRVLTDDRRQAWLRADQVEII